MADTAFQKQYRQEYIAGFESGDSPLRMSVTTEFVRKGNEAIFLVADSGSAEARTRGVNGLITARSDNLTQNTATLVEWHDLVRKTDFNIFASQGDQKRIMQDTSLKVMNRKIDSDIITELATGTVDTGAAATGSLALVTKALGILGLAKVPIQEIENMWGLITPAMYAYMLRDATFTSADYVDVKPLSGGALKRVLRWAGINWLMHPDLPGVGTNAEKCFLYHKASIGHAADTENLVSLVGYDEEQGYSWARASAFMGSELLQNSGVVVINHDGSAIVGA
ncbi:phage capsid protein [Mesorhizobium sp. M1322]|uniref:phage capsid protein n=1 Tax=Mesorhizobium sp. M1322 TaxID=2957081 RepID=UPI00333DA595